MNGERVDPEQEEKDIRGTEVPFVNNMEELKQLQAQQQQQSSSSTSTEATTTTSKKEETSFKKKANDNNKSVGSSSSSSSSSSNSSEIDISKLDIRVGVIQKAWEHPDADKLFCEEIDIGEDEPRQIASGLRDYYQVDDLIGQRVLVLANLKTRKLLGFSSHGMVLCASKKKKKDENDNNNDQDVVVFVEPPPDAQIGERVIVAGYNGIPATENQVLKKKMLEAIFPMLQTNDKGVPCYKDVPLGTSVGPCLPTCLVNAAIS